MRNMICLCYKIRSLPPLCDSSRLFCPCYSHNMLQMTQPTLYSLVFNLFFHLADKINFNLLIRFFFNPFSPSKRSVPRHFLESQSLSRTKVIMLADIRKLQLSIHMSVMSYLLSAQRSPQWSPFC